MRVLTFRCDRVHLGEACIIPWGLTKQDVVEKNITLTCNECEHFKEISSGIAYQDYPKEEIKKCQDLTKNILG